MKFYVINRPNASADKIKAFGQACKYAKIKLEEINIFNYEKCKLQKNDILYRIGTDANSRVIEKLLINFNPKSFYKKNIINSLLISSDNVISATIIHRLNNIPIPKTEFINTDDKEILKKIAKELGLPIVLKEVGGQKGKGVCKADNFKQLCEIVASRIKNKKPFILREYIDSPGVSYRSIVLGNKVLVTYRNQSVHTDDFRSNVDQTKRIRKVIKLSNKEEKIMVQAVNVLGIEFGAVDFAYDSLNNPKIFEVNFPCNFIPAQELSGVDIAKEIILYLANK